MNGIDRVRFVGGGTIKGECEIVNRSQMGDLLLSDVYSLARNVVVCKRIR